MKKTRLLVAFLLWRAVIFPSALLAQSTVFTYQGFLNDSGAPANGTNYGMVFYLYTAPTNGSVLGNFGVSIVTISNGLFTTQVDFGSVFDGTPRWLEITVQKNGGAFTTLAPRQRILPTPYAIMAANASNALMAASAGSVSASNITGTLTTGQLPAAVVTNGASGVSLTGAFAGNGGGLTNLNAATLASGSLPDARLSSNVALLNANQSFSGSNTFVGVASLTNAGNTLVGTHSGGGAGLTSLNAANLSSGTLPDARLSTNVALLNGNQTFSGAVQFSSTVSASGFAGNGAGLTNLDLGQNLAGAFQSFSFTLASQPSIGEITVSVIAGDVNGDGKPDLIAAGYMGNSIIVLTNNGNGGFVLSTTNHVGPTPLGLAAADINGDGKLDLISGNDNHSISIFTNNGSGVFVLSSTLSVNSTANAVIAADVNGDGKPDVVDPDNGGGFLQVFTNNGSGGLVFSVNLITPGPVAVAAADVNGDGKRDLISANGAFGAFVYTNNGSGGFGLSANLSAYSAQKIIAVDVNGDGKPDIVTATISTNRMVVYTNNGSGGFVLASTPVTGGFPQSLATADFDGDGRPDLVTANSDGTDSILINSGGGNFTLRATLAVGASPASVAAADFNGDGRPDVVTGCAGAATLFVHLNSGFVFDGTFVGNGASLSNLNASQLSSGTIADAQLSANVALLTANNPFTGTNALNDRDLRLRGGADGNHVLGYYGGSKTFGGFAPDGPMLYGYSGGGLGAVSAGNQVALAWNSAGNVGIGATNPTNPLQVIANRTNGSANSVVYVENTSTTTNASPALRVQNDGGNTPSGALSVSANVTATSPNSAIATFGNASSFVVTITNDGTIYSKGVALTSDRNAKERFTAVDGKMILEKLAALPISEWDYKDTPGPRHLGPVAQDFHSAFGLNGADDTHISVVDEGGVALAAIQGLNRKLEEQRAELERYRAEGAELRKQLGELHELLGSKKLDRHNGETE
jgi:hypothetical protein